MLACIVHLTQRPNFAGARARSSGSRDRRRRAVSWHTHRGRRLVSMCPHRPSSQLLDRSAQGTIGPEQGVSGSWVTRRQRHRGPRSGGACPRLAAATGAGRQLEAQSAGRPIRMSRWGDGAWPPSETSPEGPGPLRPSALSSKGSSGTRSPSVAQRARGPSIENLWGGTSWGTLSEATFVSRFSGTGAAAGCQDKNKNRPHYLIATEGVGPR